MATTKLQRSRKDFAFTNKLPLGSDGKVSQEAIYFRQELERLHQHLQDQADQDFEVIATEIVRIEDFIGI